MHDSFLSDVLILDGETNETIEWLIESLHMTVYGIIERFRGDFPPIEMPRVVPIRILPG